MGARSDRSDNGGDHQDQSDPRPGRLFGPHDVIVADHPLRDRDDPKKPPSTGVPYPAVGSPPCRVSTSPVGIRAASMRLGVDSMKKHPVSHRLRFGLEEIRQSCEDRTAPLDDAAAVSSLSYTAREAQFPSSLAALNQYVIPGSAMISGWSVSTKAWYSSSLSASIRKVEILAYLVSLHGVIERTGAQRQNNYSVCSHSIGTLCVCGCAAQSVPRFADPRERTSPERTDSEKASTSGRMSRSDQAVRRSIPVASPGTASGTRAFGLSHAPFSRPAAICGLVWRRPPGSLP